MTLPELEQSFPQIPWRKPIQINERFYACRVCIAQKGLRGSDVPKLPNDPETVCKHISEAHE